MTKPALRPSFRRTLPVAPEELIALLRDQLAERGGPCAGHGAGRCVELFVPEKERHFWSPWLSLMVEADEEDPGRSHLIGRFSPQPVVWTGFMAAWAVVIFSMVFAGSWGFAQWSLGMTPTGLVSLPLGALLCGGLFAASQVGQRLARDQMQSMSQLVEELLEVRFGAEQEALSESR